MTGDHIGSDQGPSHTRKPINPAFILQEAYLVLIAMLPLLIVQQLKTKGFIPREDRRLQSTDNSYSMIQMFQGRSVPDLV